MAAARCGVLVLVSWWLLGGAALDPVAAAEPAPGEHAAQHGHDAHEPHIGEEGVNRDPTELRKDLAVWTFVVFVLLMAGLWATAWKPILGALEQREKHIAQSIAEAERLQREAQNLLAQHEQKLAEAAAQVRAMLEEARRDAQRTREEILAQARQEADQERQRALAEIQQAKRVALQELAQRAGELAVSLASRILRAQVDPQAHRQLISQALEELAEVEPSRN